MSSDSEKSQREWFQALDRHLKPPLHTCGTGRAGAPLEITFMLSMLVR